MSPALVHCVLGSRVPQWAEGTDASAPASTCGVGGGDGPRVGAIPLVLGQEGATESPLRPEGLGRKAEPVSHLPAAARRQLLLLPAR